MANAVYPKFKEYALSVALAGGTQKTGTLRAALITSGYTFNAAHDFKDDLGANIVGTPTAISSPTFTDGVFDGGDVTFTAVTGSAVGAIVVYLDTSGADGTDPLLCYIDTGVTGLPVTPNGGDIKITWSNGPARIFAL
jgi:hypothetical protein